MADEVKTNIGVNDSKKRKRPTKYIVPIMLFTTALVGLVLLFTTDFTSTGEEGADSTPICTEIGREVGTAWSSHNRRKGCQIFKTPGLKIQIRYNGGPVLAWDTDGAVPRHNSSSWAKEVSWRRVPGTKNTGYIYFGDK